VPKEFFVQPFPVRAGCCREARDGGREIGVPAEVEIAVAERDEEVRVLGHAVADAAEDVRLKAGGAAAGERIAHVGAHGVGEFGDDGQGEHVDVGDAGGIEGAGGRAGRA